MPPKKPAPKLTKKELKELALAEAKKKEEEEKQRLEEEAERLAEENRLKEQEFKRLLIEERDRVAVEKEEYSTTLQERLKNENNAEQAFNEAEDWSNLTTEYYKDYNVQGTKLSTFINIFRDEPFKSPEKTLTFCEEAEIIASRLEQQMLTFRALNDTKSEKEAAENMREIHRVEISKLEEIMIIMANQAEDMEEKNNDLARNKGEQNRRAEGRKLLEYNHYLSDNFKIGMFLNSTTTKAVNKFRPIEIKEFGLNTEIPSKWINANTIVKFEWTNFNPFESEVQAEFLIVGGVFNLEFYEMLASSKRINNITLKKHFKGKEILEKFKLQPSLVKDPFQIQYQIPKNVFLSSFDQNSLKFAQYDVSTGKWTILPNDTVQEYDPVEKKVVCKIAKPEPIAYVQDRCCDFPYINWELRTIEDGKVLLDIELKRFLIAKPEEEPEHLIVTFEISENLVRLSMSEKYPEFEDLSNNFNTPERLLSELWRRGIYLLPNNLDYKEASLPIKMEESERNAIRDIAYAVESFYIRSEPNNSDEIKVKMRDNLDHEHIFLEDQEKDWSHVRWGEDKCWVEGKEFPQKHLNFEVLLEKDEIYQSECVERIKYDRKFLLRKAIIKMLGLTRVLAFTVAEEQPSKLKEVLKSRILVS